MMNSTASLNTRGEIATHIAGKVQQTGSTAKRNEILRDLDHAYRIVLAQYEWPQLIRFEEAAVQQAANQAFFFLPKEVQDVIAIQDATTPLNLAQVTANKIMNQSQGFATIQGLSYEVSRMGDSGVKVVLDAGTALEIASSGTDVRTGFVTGRRSGEQKTQAFTLNGTNQVSLGSWDDVFSVQVSSSSTANTLTIRIVTVNTTVAVIAPNETIAQYQRRRLYPVPAGAITLRVVYRYTPPQIFSEDHQYVLPIQDYLVEWGLALAYEADRKWAPAQAHKQEAQRILSFVVRTHMGEEIEVASPLYTWGGQLAGGGIIVNRHGG